MMFMNTSGQWVTIPVPANSGAVSNYTFTYQLTANGAGIVQSAPPSVTEQSTTDPMKEKIEAYNRAMRSVG